MTRRTWTDDELCDAVVQASSLNDVFTRLGLSVGGSAWRRMQEHILRLDLDTSHWRVSGTQPSRGGALPVRPIDDAQLVRVLPGARSVGQVIDELGLARSSPSYRRVRARIVELGLDTGHLVGQGWRRGSATPVTPARPLEEILVRDSSYRGTTSRLRDRLVLEGILEQRCARCGLTQWNGEPAPLELDHVNGDPTDNRLENLRILCANCHAQTPTYCGRNIGNGYSSRSSGGPHEAR